MLKVLFIGDVVGVLGCKTVRAMLPKIKKKYFGLDVVIANCENSAKGNGVSLESASYLLESGCDVLTGGNHSFRNFSIYKSLKDGKMPILRPLNISRKSVGRGFLKFKSLIVVNLLGQAYLDASSCAFEVMQSLLKKLDSKNIFVDFHAEATGEKGALANFLDGKVSAVVGTHTHVQTKDARILKNGTAFLTDVGMVGPLDSVLGVVPELVIRRIVTKMPVKFEVKEQGKAIFSAVFLKIDETTGKTQEIETIYEVC